MDPNLPSKPTVGMPASNEPSIGIKAPNNLQSSSNDSSTNKQAIIFVTSFAFILFIAAAFAYYFIFIGPYSKPDDSIAVITQGYKAEPTSAPPTPTPTVNPWVVIKQAYANPFEEETQYVNPFEDENPFSNLE